VLEISIERTGDGHLEGKVLAVNEGEEFEFVEELLVHSLL